jgi:hypothetical protein
VIFVLAFHPCAFLGATLLAGVPFKILGLHIGSTGRSVFVCVIVPVVAACLIFNELIVNYFTDASVNFPAGRVGKRGAFALRPVNANHVCRRRPNCEGSRVQSC